MSLRKVQNGVMLLEALIAILIFSLGILGLVGMQASAVRASRDAQFRSEAGLLANELIGEMRTDNRDGAALVSNFASAQTCPTTPSPTDTPFCQWINRVATVLPGVGANPPTVTVTPGVNGPPRTASTVTVTVRWMAPNETTAHSYRVVVQVI